MRYANCRRHRIGRVGPDDKGSNLSEMSVNIHQSVMSHIQEDLNVNINSVSPTSTECS